MQLFKLDHFTKGWFVGDFEKGIVRTKEFEVAVHTYRAGEAPEPHFHKIAKEITVIHSGKFTMNGVTLSAGDVVVLEPNEVARFTCLEDGSDTIVKIPSVPNDKYSV